MAPHIVLWLRSEDEPGCCWESLQAVKALNSSVSLALPIRDIDIAAASAAAAASTARNVSLGVIGGLQAAGGLPADDRVAAFDILGPSYKAPRAVLRGVAPRAPSMAWTLNSEAEAWQAAALGARWVVSDRPLAMAATLARRFRGCHVPQKGALGAA